LSGLLVSFSSILDLVALISDSRPVRLVVMVVGSLLDLGFAVQNFVDFSDGQVPAVTDEKFAHGSVTGSAHTFWRLENPCQLFRDQIPA